MCKCKYCDKEFKTAGNCRRHEISHHEQPDVEYTCKFCGKNFTVYGISHHELKCHKNPDRLMTEKQLLGFKKKPTAPVPGYCTFCGKECKNKNSLSNHERLCKLNPNKDALTAHKSGFSIWLEAHPGRSLTSLQKDSKESHTRSRATLSARYKAGELVPHQKGKARTAEEKAKISAALKANPNGGGLRKNSGRGKKGWYKGIYCDSTYELAYVAYNIDHGVVFNRCPKTVCYEYQYKNQSHKYYPDFMLEDGSLVEVKGYHNEVVDLKIASVTDRPINVLYEKDLEFAFSYIKETYGVKKIEELYKMENELRAAS